MPANFLSQISRATDHPVHGPRRGHMLCHTGETAAKHAGSADRKTQAPFGDNDPVLDRSCRAGSSLQFGLNCGLQADDLRPDRIVGDAVSAQSGDDTGNALSPERVGARTMDDLQIVGDRADQGCARMKRKGNQFSHVGTIGHGWFTNSEPNLFSGLARPGLFPLQNAPEAPQKLHTISTHPERSAIKRP